METEAAPKYGNGIFSSALASTLGLLLSCGYGEVQLQGQGP